MAKMPTVGDVMRITESAAISSKADWPGIWMATAKNHLSSARRARNKFMRDRLAASLDREFQNCLVALTSLAFSVESVSQVLYGGGKPKPQTAPPARKWVPLNLGDYLGQTLFEQGRIDGHTATALSWLFHLRNQSVHPLADWESLGKHPAGVRTTPEVALFSIETVDPLVADVKKVVALLDHPV